MTKPSRSDVVLDAEEQIKITNRIRAQFDSMAPKRPIKPNRSEPDSSPQIPSKFISNDTLPELNKFRSLQSQSHPISFERGNSMIQEEYVETQYYNELDSIDKQHHKTGSGFIQVVNKGDEDEELFQIKNWFHGAIGMASRGYWCNPATNHSDYQIFNSEKPNRSESS